MSVIRQLSDEALELIQRTTREVSRRQRGNVRPSQGRWHKKGTSTPGGGSDCCCTCVCVDPNLQHPAGFLTVRDWSIGLTNDTEWARASNDMGDVRVKAGSYSVSWNETNERWEYTLTTADVDWRNDSGTVSTPTTVTGTVYMDWVSLSDPVLIRFDFDGTGAT